MTVPKPQNATLIDSISEGYAAINRRPWLLLVPLLLNVYLWFGAQLSFGPLFSSIHRMLRNIQPGLVDQSEMQVLYDQLLANGSVDLRSQLTFLNFVPILRQYVVGSVGDSVSATGVPAIQELPRLIDAGRTDTIEVATVGGALLAFVLLNALALALSAVFLAQVGTAVRQPHGARWLPLGGLAVAPRVGLAILGAVGVIVGVTLALGLPFLFFAYLLIFLSPTIGLLALELLFVVGFWINIYIGFYREAIVINDQGPLRAIYTSFNVVRRNFWGTLGFLALSLVISLGSGVIWHRLVGSTAGLIVAMIGSAYIGSGLLAARMAFFRERLRRWQDAPVQPSGLRARN
ncbi:MAG TPA: hypothetical protein VFU22_24750 [Roseiflexaceae bacterium]|nr:hypothetical protein [Roseiflexaceae bacterium]